MSLVSPTAQVATIEDEDAFMKAYRPAVQTDVRTAAHKIKRGHPYELLITPARVALRCPDTAYTRADLSSPECKAAVWLRQLFHHEAAAYGLEVTFGIDRKYKANCGDHLEDVLLMRVTFAHQ